MQSNQREQELRSSEQELRNRVDEVIRVVIRSQGGNQGGGGGLRDRNISEYKAVLNLKVLTDFRAGPKEWHTKFINVMSQVRPGTRDLLRELEAHRDDYLQSKISTSSCKMTGIETGMKTGVKVYGGYWLRRPQAMHFFESKG